MDVRMAAAVERCAQAASEFMYAKVDSGIRMRPHLQIEIRSLNLAAMILA